MSDGELDRDDPSLPACPFSLVQSRRESGKELVFYHCCFEWANLIAQKELDKFIFEFIHFCGESPVLQDNNRFLQFMSY